MVRSSILVLLLVAASGIVQAQKKPAKSKEEILFTVNNRPVTVNEFLYLYNKNYNGKSEPTTREKVQEYLDLFVNFKLKVEEARRRGYDTTRTFVKEFNSYREELRKPYLPDARLVDSLVQLTYNRLKEEVQASHLLIMVKPDATPKDTLDAYNRLLDLKKRAQAGEDFGSLVDTYASPEAKQNHGDLGYFTALQMVYPFESAAYSGKVGDVVGPVRTRFGYHLIKIRDRRPARGEVEVSHIMIRTQSDQDNTEARNKILEAYDQLSGGASWNDVCKAYSDDVSTKESGGRLRPFGVGVMNAVPEFEQAAFSLQQPGDFSDPVKTAYGWHIVRLENKIPLPSFDELAPSLKTRVARDERVQVSRQAAENKLRRDLGFHENQNVKEKLAALADSSLIQGNWKVTSASKPTDILFGITGKQVTVADFFGFVKKNQRKVSLSPRAYFEQLYKAQVDGLISEGFEQAIIAKNPDFSLLLAEYYEGIMLFDIMEREVWNKASSDSAGQVNYFNTHRSDYQAGQRAHAQIWSSADQQSIQLLQAALEARDSVQAQTLIQSRKIREEKGLFQQADRPVLSKIDWKPGNYSAEAGGMYYLVRLNEMVAPGLLSFDEARATIIADYQNYLEKSWLEQLKKKYPVKIHESARKHVLEKLVR
jgi:peptidyl-prolyl cis-trans isomerase SurA